jgi:ribosomal-protein-alanine N-acetyltransferase
VIAPLPPEALVLETERLRLTPFTRDDQDIATAVLCDPDVMAFVSEPETPESVAAHMADAVKRGAGGCIGIWCIRRKDTGQKIGDALLMPVPIDEDDYDWSTILPDAYPPGRIEVGYLLIPEAWGQGFATEACARLLRFAFEQTALTQVVATTDPGNTRSQHVLQKCGLKPLGRQRAYNWDDVSWFEITRDAWRAR